MPSTVTVWSSVIFVIVYLLSVSSTATLFTLTAKSSDLVYPSVILSSKLKLPLSSTIRDEPFIAVRS